MGKQQGRSNRGTSFGKRQDADDSFRKKKKEGGSSYRKKDDGDKGPRTTKGGKFRSTTSSYKPRPRRDETGGGTGERKSYGSSRPSGGGERKSYGRPRRNDEGGGERRSYGARPNREEGGERRSYPNRAEGGERRGFKGSSYEGGKRKFSDGNSGSGERKSFGEKRSFGDKKSFGEKRSYGEKKSYGDKKPYGDKKSDGDKKSYDKKPFRQDKPERRSFVDSKVQSHRERVETNDEQTTGAPEQSSDGLIRLNKFISNSGVCSRREADELIKLGVITVNGVTITEMGHKVKPTDDVRHEGKRLTAEKPVYILLNKPKGFITTTDDPQERNTVMQLIAGACKERVYPVGRLDRNTTGLLLLTNDGDLTDKLTHPSFNAKKIYKVELDKPLTKADLQRIIDGVSLEEGKAMVDDIAIVSDDNKTVGIELHIGWNHVVRRIFNALEYDVVKLDRVVYAGLDKKDLKRGQWRFLKGDEIVRLKHFK